jgi:hypothetical protein
MPGKLIGVKVEPELADALDELVRATHVRSKSALMRRIAYDHVWANVSHLSAETRELLNKTPRLQSRRHRPRP